MSSDGSIVIRLNHVVVLTSAGPEAPRLNVPAVLAHFWVLLDLCPEVEP